MLVRNITIPTEPVQSSSKSCSAFRNEQCLCRSVFSASNNSTSFVCDCASVRNFRVANPSQCQCQTLRDFLGNQLSSCSCPVAYAVQYTQDEECACQRVSNLLTNTSILSCTNCSIASAGNPITIQEDQCECVNAFDFSTNRTYLSCVCKNVPQCVDPSSIVQQPVVSAAAPPCRQSYPCSCAQNATTSNLTCSCQNPSANMTASITHNATQCACQTRLNIQNLSFDQSCQCCLADEFVRANLIGPVVCPRPTDLKETCACTNQTVGNSTFTTLNCNCQHPAVASISASLQFPSQGLCDCPDISLGNKICQCCVPQDIQIQQQQPICNANSSIQNCQCTPPQGNSTSQICSCNNARNGFNFPGMNNVASNNCFCLNARSCNCCVSEDQFRQFRPQCPADRDASSSCRCDNVNGTLQCSCANQYFFNQPSIASFRPQNCACYGAANQTTGIDCQCCATPAELSPAPVCAVTEQFVNCQSCRFDALTKTVQCACTGSHVFGTVSPVALNNLTFSTSSCQCTVDAMRNNTVCNCCVARNIWASAVPQCNRASESLDRCMCANNLVNSTEERNMTIPTNVTRSFTCRQTGCSGELCSSESMASNCKWQNRFACYASATCQYNTTTGTCGWTTTTALTACLARPPAVATVNVPRFQNTTNRTVTTLNQTTLENITTLVNVTVTRSVESCACNSTRISGFSYISSTPSSHCGQDANNSSIYQCCSSNNQIESAFLGRQQCSAGLDVADCACNSSRNATCQCTPLGTQISYRALVLDTSRCQCIGSSNGQQCRCCIGKIESLLPRAPVCNTTVSNSQVCDCEEVFTVATNRTNFRCSCRQNVTSQRNMTRLVIQNVTRQANFTFNTTVNVTVNVTEDNTSATNTTNTTSNTTINATASNMTVSNSTSNTTSNSTAANITQQTRVIQQVVQVTELRNVTVEESRNESFIVNVNQIRTTTNTIFPSQCSCLQYLNGTRIQNLCTCCVRNPFSCNATQTTPAAAQLNCACRNVSTVVNRRPVTSLSCNCLRPDNNVFATFSFSNAQCGCNAADSLCQCCLNSTQFSSMIPVLTCNATTTQRQSCSCRNATGPFSNDLSCNCTRPENGIISRNDRYPRAQCLDAFNNDSYQCCVPQMVVDRQIPTKSCLTIGAQLGQNVSNQLCRCQNVTLTSVNATTNVTTRTNALNCQCTNQEFLNSASYNLTVDRCLVYNSSVSDCCLTEQERAQQMPQLRCLRNAQSVTGCRCRSSVVNGAFDRNCDCGVTYQGKNYTVPDLTTAGDNCMCNSTTCGCCITQDELFAATERQCANNEFRSLCDSCVSTFSNATNRTSTTCAGCLTLSSDRATVFPSQTYTNVAADSFLCRSNNMSENCTYCHAQRPAGPVAPQCPANFSEVLPNCMCAPAVNGTQVCNCSRVSGNIESYFPSIAARNCSCLNFRQNGREVSQCQCCVATSQVTLANPTCPTVDESVEQCACSGDFNCDCSKFRNFNTVLRNLRKDANSCSCPNNNATTKACGCCVSFENYKDALTPSCSPQDVSGLCQCANVTVTVGRVRTTTQRCNCTGELRQERGVFLNNLKMNVTPSSCGGNYTENGVVVRRCCIPPATFSALPVRQCRVADQLNATCNFFYNETQRANSTVREGVCTARVNSITYFFEELRVNSSDCSCLDLTTANNRTGARCSCCLPRSMINTTLIRAPTCNASTTTTQQCSCRSTGDALTQVCDCTRRIGNTQSNRPGLTLDKAQCSCLNQTIDGQSNAANCQCCVPNPPPTQCERLAEVRPSNLRCRCAYIINSLGVSEFRCEQCNSTVNATTTISRRDMPMNESSCCCVELSDPITRKGYKACNCTQPATFQTQNCQCRSVAGVRNTTRVNCECTDCTRTTQRVSVPVNQCKCPSSFFTFSANMSSTNSGKAENTTTNATRTNATTNSTSNSTRANTTNATTNATRTNVTNATSTANSTNATTNGTRTNVTNSTNATNTTNATTNGTRTNVINSTNASNTTNATSNGTRTNVTTSTNATNATTNGTRTNVTTNGTNSNVTTNATTNGTRTNVTTNATQPTNATNSSTTTPVVVVDPSLFSCSCDVEFSGLCPAFNPNAPVDEAQCDAGNRQATVARPASTVNAGCKYQYEYLVAVVATNKDASLLMQLQSYQNVQADIASFLKLSMAALMALAASVLFFY